MSLDIHAAEAIHAAHAVRRSMNQRRRERRGRGFQDQLEKDDPEDASGPTPEDAPSVAGRPRAASPPGRPFTGRLLDIPPRSDHQVDYEA